MLKDDLVESIVIVQSVLTSGYGVFWGYRFWIVRFCGVCLIDVRDSYA